MTRQITLIVAMDLDRTIGRDNDLPWHLPADLAFFRRRTMGKPMIMGRRAYEAIGKPLPGRTNIVLSRASSYRAPGCLRAAGVDQALALAGEAPEVMIIGGADIYAAFLPLATGLDLTLVDTRVAGDRWFPDWAQDDWTKLDEVIREADRQNPFRLRFQTYRRGEALPASVEADRQ